MASRFVLILFLLGLLTSSAEAINCRQELRILASYAKSKDLQGSYFYLQARLEQLKEKLLGRHPATSKKYFSQNGQDRWLFENVFRNKLNGVFVDIGAYDGVNLSNSYFFETALGWSGVAVEPIPSAFEKLARNRKCQVLHGCVSASGSPQRFTIIEGADGASLNPSMHSGITAHYDPLHLGRIDGFLKDSQFQRREIDVASISFEKIIEELGQSHIDYLSIDTEGAELEILQTIPFGKVNISVIGVENNYADPRIHQLLVKNGYHRVKRIGQDDFYFLNGFEAAPYVSPKNVAHEAKGYPQNAIPVAQKQIR